MTSKRAIVVATIFCLPLLAPVAVADTADGRSALANCAEGYAYAEAGGGWGDKEAWAEVEKTYNSSSGSKWGTHWAVAEGEGVSFGYARSGNKAAKCNWPSSIIVPYDAIQDVTNTLPDAPDVED